MNKSIRICKMKKEQISQYMDNLSDMVSNPKYICSKCARAANKKHNLCKATKIH
ncbi:MAG: hypothetical protein JXQ67_00445 [Campylobacterales bacterium]|nr:hypothetical protein [Campylobacterales bacterium]